MHNNYLTYALDILGLVAILSGAVVVARSRYLTETSRDAAVLIDTQRKRIDALDDTVQRLADERAMCLKEIQDLKAQLLSVDGQLKTFKELNLVKPETVAKLVENGDSMLRVLETIASGQTKEYAGTTTARKAYKKKVNNE